MSLFVYTLDNSVIWVVIIYYGLHILAVLAVVLNGMFGHRRWGKVLKYFATCVHILCVITFIVTFAVGTTKRGEKTFIMTIIIWSLQLIIALIVLPFPHIGARLLSPVVTAIFKIMRKITCGRLDDKISKLEKWDGNNNNDD